MQRAHAATALVPGIAARFRRSKILSSIDAISHSRSDRTYAEAHISRQTAINFLLRFASWPYMALEHVMRCCLCCAMLQCWVAVHDTQSPDLVCHWYSQGSSSRGTFLIDILHVCYMALL